MKGKWTEKWPPKGGYYYVKYRINGKKNTHTHLTFIFSDKNYKGKILNLSFYIIGDRVIEYLPKNNKDVHQDYTSLRGYFTQKNFEVVFDSIVWFSTEIEFVPSIKKEDLPKYKFTKTPKTKAKK